MIIILTLLALVAFAANSILCRIALGQHYIDPAGFTIVRLLSGSIALYLILVLHSYRKQHTENIRKHIDELPTAKGSWLGGILLFIYALSFSYAYKYLDTGTGALILFGSVQVCMILSMLITKRKLLILEWLGLIIACLGFIYLIYPDLTTPSLVGFVLMMFSGVAWASYTLIGRDSKVPLIDTCYNFFRTIPFILILALMTISNTEYSYVGVLCAILSGAVMSGLGYAIWYRVLNSLTITTVSIIQLLVPIIAALGGIVFMNEILTTRLQVSTIMVLGGIAIVLLSKAVTYFKVI